MSFYYNLYSDFYSESLPIQKGSNFCFLQVLPLVTSCFVIQPSLKCVMKDKKEQDYYIIR